MPSSTPILHKARLYFFTAIAMSTAVAVSGCDQGVHTDATIEQNAALGASNIALSDSQQFIQLSGSVAPLERLQLTLPTDTPDVLIDYISVDTGTLVSQPAFKTSGGHYSALALPSSGSYMDTRNLVSNDLVLGQINVLPFPDNDPNISPGVYALTAMNSILFGLREEMARLDVVNQLNNDIDSRLSIAEKLISLEEAVIAYQENIRIIDDVVVFGTPITNPTTGDVLLDADSLFMLDSVFQVLFTRLAEESLFLDGDSGVPNSNSSDQNLTFEQFSQAAKIRLSTTDGVSALASLTLLIGEADDIEYTQALKQVLAITQASLLPAILANEVSDIHSGTTQSKFAGVAANFLIGVEQKTGNTSGFIYQVGLNTLRSTTVALESQ